MLCARIDKRAVASHTARLGLAVRIIICNVRLLSKLCRVSTTHLHYSPRVCFQKASLSCNKLCVTLCHPSTHTHTCIYIWCYSYIHNNTKSNIREQKKWWHSTSYNYTGTNDVCVLLRVFAYMWNNNHVCVSFRSTLFFVRIKVWYLR